MSVVSRGGAFMIAYMTHNDCENPFYAEYDYLLEIAREHDVTLSLGDGMRPGCISDAGDGAMFTECITLGKLVMKHLTVLARPSGHGYSARLRPYNCCYRGVGRWHVRCGLPVHGHTI